MILVTGASGRVGKYLVEALLKKGEKVRAFVRDRGNLSPRKNLEIIEGNILDKSSLREAVRGVNTIYHLAAGGVYYNAPENLTYDVNLQGTKNLVDVSKGKKIIFLSTTSVYGKKINNIFLNENSPCRPQSPYAKAKLEAERIVLKNRGVVIRSAKVMGKDFESGFRFLVRGLQDKKLPLMGNGKNYIHFIHIKDLIQALLLANTKGRRGQIYLIAGKDFRTLKECYGLVCKYLKIKPPQNYMSPSTAKLMLRLYRLRGKKIAPEFVDDIVQNRVFDISKARKELEYKPKITYEYVAKEMVEQFKKT